MGQDQSTLIAQIAFVVIIIIPALITVGLLVVVAWRFIPMMVKQMQQLIDNNAQLTKIAKQNADQFQTTQTTLASITPELVKQTKAIEAGNSLILTQGIDFRSYQTLVSDNLSHHTSQIDANTEKVNMAIASMSQLEITLANLPAQIVLAIQGELDCEKVLNEFRNLRTEVTRVMFQQQRSTGTFPAVPTPQPSTPIPSNTPAP